jgi:hypothetical protein
MLGTMIMQLKRQPAALFHHNTLDSPSPNQQSRAPLHYLAFVVSHRPGRQG